MNIKCLICPNRAVPEGTAMSEGPNSWLGFHEGRSKETCFDTKSDNSCVEISVSRMVPG